MSIIKVDTLTKRYGDFVAVDGISFEVKKGTLLGFLGINGAGKSTTINMLSTLLKPDDGGAQICGLTLGKADQEIRRKIGIVYQQNCLDDILTVKENLICRGILHGASKQEAKTQLDKLCEILKLEALLKKTYRTLSGGQRRRCEIAAALMHTPEILFLDEPTTGLDPATRKDVWETIDSIRQNEKMTVFLTTHYMEEAAVADNIIILDRGKIVASGTPFDLKSQYAKDKLKLYCEGENIEEIQRRLGDCSDNLNITQYGVEIGLQSTMEALAVVERIKEKINGFEVIQGNMDDVFLNAVGRKSIEGMEG